MGNAGRVPVRFENIARLVEAQHAAMIEPGRQPFVAGHLLHHAQTEARFARGEVEGRGADADQRQPIRAIGSAVDVVGIARQRLDRDFQFTLKGAGYPVAIDLAERGAGDQQRLPVVRDAYAVRKVKMRNQRRGLAGRRIIDHQPAVGPALDNVERVRGHFVARRAVAEIDLAVWRDVEIVGHAQPRIVVELVPGSVGLVGELEDRAVGLDPVNAHPGDANDEVLIPIELHPQRSAADVSEYLTTLEIGSRKADDVAVAGASVDPVLPVDDHVLGTLDLVEPDCLGMNQPVVLSEGGIAVGGDRGSGRQWHARRIDVCLLDHLAAIFRPFHIDADGGKENDAGGGRSHVAGDAHADQTVGQHEDDDRADHRPPNGAAATRDRSSAQHDRGHSLEFPAEAGRRIGAPLSRRIEHAAERTEQAR